MNTANLNKLLSQYKKIDLDYAVISKERELLKDKINELMKKNEAESYTFNEYRVSRFTSERVMYIKAKLEEIVPEKLLKQCAKTIVSGGLRITYKEGK